MECIVCGKPVPERRMGHGTCSGTCGVNMAVAWTLYLRRHKDEIRKKALAEHRAREGKGA